MAESEEELKSLLMKVKEEGEKVVWKLNIQKAKIMASGPITSWPIDGETVETVSDFIFWGSKITPDGDCSHEIKRCSLLGRKVMTNLESIFEEGNGTPLQYSCLENPRDGEAWWAAVYGVTQSWTWLKQLSSRLVITFLPRSKRLLISWLHSPSGVILEPQKIKSDIVSAVSSSISHEVMGQMPWSSFSECWAFSQLFHSPLSLSSRGFLVPLHFLP